MPTFDPRSGSFLNGFLPKSGSTLGEKRSKKQLPSVDDMRWQTKEQKKEVKTMSEVPSLCQAVMKAFAFFHLAPLDVSALQRA